MRPSTCARLSLALLSLLAPLWLVTLMPSESAFDPTLRMASFEPWHALVVVATLSLTFLTAGLLARS